MPRTSHRSRAGFGLLETLIAVAVVATGVTAMQRLVTRSVATLEVARVVPEAHP